MLTESFPQISKKTYDEEDDVLYLTFENSHGNSFGDRIAPGIDVMRDIQSREITGFIIFDPKRRLEIRQNSLNEEGFSKIDLRSML